MNHPTFSQFCIVERIAYQALCEQKKLADRGKHCWGSGIKLILNGSGLGFVWNMTDMNRRRMMRTKQIIKQRILDIDKTFILEKLQGYSLLSNYSTHMDGEWAIPEMYRSDSFTRRRYVSCFRLNSIWSLPIKKNIVEDDAYVCTRCNYSFKKPLTWKHFLYVCPQLPRCKMTSRPNPLSTSAFRLTESGISFHIRKYGNTRPPLAVMAGQLSILRFHSLK